MLIKAMTKIMKIITVMPERQHQEVCIQAMDIQVQAVHPIHHQLAVHLIQEVHHPDMVFQAVIQVQ
jgi:hypothetical protein